jgi:hypothetical protein
MKLQIDHIRTYILLLVVTAAAISCKKNTEAPMLAPGAVYIKEAVATDTLSAPKLSTDKDTIFTFKLEAAVKVAAASGSHTAILGVDTSEMSAYRAKYGNMAVLPSSCYFIPFANCNIPIGATESNAAEINIVNQTALRPGTTYVLPVVVKNVDGQTPGTIGQDQVIYLLIKTTGIDYGSPISKASWKIVSFSSTAYASLFGAANVLDNNMASYWESGLGTPMPQFVTIDMGQSYNLKAVTYQNYPNFSKGGNPTQIMIELSTNGTTWVNSGTFADTAPSSIVKNLLITPVTPARYIRFTVLQATTYSGLAAVGISEIGANSN